jgi:hypothetical protein
MTADEIGLPYRWRYGAGNRDIAGSSYAEATHAYTGVGLRPLSPVHVRGRRNGGDLTISWIRRTRVDGDSWDGIEVPLGEEAEAYEVDILDGSVVKRTLASVVPTLTYSAAQQTADFGAPQANVAVRVYQLSPSRGRGAGRLAVV